MDFNEMLDLEPMPRTLGRREADFGDDLRDAALALERVLTAAHERGAADAVAVLSSVSALLRGLADTEASPATPAVPARARRNESLPVAPVQRPRRATRRGGGAQAG